MRPFVEPASVTVDQPAGGQWQVSTTGGSFPRWRPDGKELYYIGLDGQMMAVPVTATGTILEPGTPVALFQPHIIRSPGDGPLQYDISREGRFLINTIVDADAAPITILQNWKPPAK